MMMTILLQRSPIIMKLIGVFGVLLAISPAVFAAVTIKCTGGGMSTSTVENCNNQPCTFDYAKGILHDDEIRKFVRRSKK